MDIRKVRKLIQLMQESDVREIEIREGEEMVRISKGAGMVFPPGAAGAAPARPESSGQLVRAPMVGTFYRAPSPGSPPFVDVGDKVKVGDILCIIESMKMMNEIKSDCAGRIGAILVHNDEPVEFDQGLFTIS